MSERDDCIFEEQWYDHGDDAETLINITIIARTDKAILIEHNNRQAWFSKSIIVLDEDTITYPLWLDPEWITIAKRMKEIEGDF